MAVRFKKKNIYEIMFSFLINTKTKIIFSMNNLCKYTLNFNYSITYVVSVCITSNSFVKLLLNLFSLFDTMYIKS